jgi:hypothetical protein
MISFLRKHFAVILVGMGLAIAPMLAATGTSSAQGIEFRDGLHCGVNFEFDDLSGQCTPQEDGVGNVTDLISMVINVFSMIVGAIAVIMIVWGGLRYIMAGGDSSKITAAKNTIIFAVIGLVIVALAQLIVRFILGQI